MLDRLIVQFQAAIVLPDFPVADSDTDYVAELLTNPQLAFVLSNGFLVFPILGE